MNNSYFKDIHPDTVEMTREMFNILIQSEEYADMMCNASFRESEAQADKLFNELDKRTNGKYTDLIKTAQDAAINVRAEAENIAIVYGIYIARRIDSIINRPCEFAEMFMSRGIPAAELYPIPET